MFNYSTLFLCFLFNKNASWIMGWKREGGLKVKDSRRVLKFPFFFEPRLKGERSSERKRTRERDFSFSLGKTIEVNNSYRGYCPNRDGTSIWLVKLFALIWMIWRVHLVLLLSYIEIWLFPFFCHRVNKNRFQSISPSRSKCPLQLIHHDFLSPLFFLIWENSRGRERTLIFLTDLKKTRSLICARFRICLIWNMKF